jgi:SOS-response transcriptional repressor LexA
MANRRPCGNSDGAWGMSSPSSVLYQLRRLEERGAVRRTDDSRRSWVTW